MFQSTRPVRGATVCKALCSPCHIVSIHAPRAGRDWSGRHGAVLPHVSIHAPRAGRDTMATTPTALSVSFNPRAPCGARRRRAYPLIGIHGFQSTRPVRGATRRRAYHHLPPQFQSTRPVRGATETGLADAIRFDVSIHAPRAGRDHQVNPICLEQPVFQSTRPVRGATSRECIPRRRQEVSIHAPRAGRDGKRSYDFPLLPHIYGYYSPQI